MSDEHKCEAAEVVKLSSNQFGDSTVMEVCKCLKSRLVTISAVGSTMLIPVGTRISALGEWGMHYSSELPSLDLTSSYLNSCGADGSSVPPSGKEIKKVI